MGKDIDSKISLVLGRYLDRILIQYACHHRSNIFQHLTSHLAAAYWSRGPPSLLPDVLSCCILDPKWALVFLENIQWESATLQNYPVFFGELSGLLLPLQLGFLGFNVF